MYQNRGLKYLPILKICYEFFKQGVFIFCLNFLQNLNFNIKNIYYFLLQL